MARPKRMADCHPDRPHRALGLCDQCYSRVCDKRRHEQKHEYYLENRERILRQTARWKEENKEHLDEYNRKYRKENTEMCRIRNQKWEGQNPGYKREYHLKRMYDMSLVEYDHLLEIQNHRCAICGITPEENGKRLYVDHDHETGEVRGLLCQGCNMLLGNAQDNIDILLSAISYLRCNDAA